MGFSFNDLFNVGEDAFDNAMNQVKETVLPGIIAGAEKKAAQLLSGEADKNQQILQANIVKQIQSPPSDPNSIGAYIGGVYASALSKVGLQQFGGAILIGAVVIGAGAIFLFAKKGK